MSALLAAVREALAGERAWLVGGAVRDRLLGREREPDLDIALDGDARAAARRVARATGGSPFALSDAFGGWRVVLAEGGQVDLLPVAGGTLEADLAARDLTVNAMAEPLAGGELVDPHGGTADLAARRLRMVSPGAFDADPLRVVRVARLACDLRFAPEAGTLAAARAAAGGLRDVAPERVFAELRAIIGGPAPVAGLELLGELGAEAVVLPELHALRGVDQSAYHHKDVHGHTLEVLARAADLQADPGAVLGDAALGPPVRALLDAPLGDGLSRGDGLRWAALLHDAAKPVTRTQAGGRVGFPGHDRLGEELARGVLARLRAAERVRAHVALLTRHHLRLGFLVHEAPLDARATYAYLRACEPAPADVTLLTVADRLATRGRKAGEAIARHLALAREVLALALGPWPEHRAAAPLVRGDALAEALGLEPGPELGRLLAVVDEARWAGEVRTADDAVALARRALARPPGPGERGGAR